MKKHKYLEETVSMIIRVKPEVRKKWKKQCVDKGVTYAGWIEEKLSTPRV